MFLNLEMLVMVLEHDLAVAAPETRDDFVRDGDPAFIMRV